MKTDLLDEKLQCEWEGTGKGYNWLASTGLVTAGLRVNPSAEGTFVTVLCLFMANMGKAQSRKNVIL